MDAARLVKMARRRAALTQRELARRSGIAQPTVSRIESGKMSPTFDTLAALIQACGMQVVALEREGTGADLAMVQDLLRMTPAERLAYHARGAGVLRRMRAAKPVAGPA
ncbi:MAG: helix-turn-helix transcriptional regulator [Actinomycetota bacterium]